MTDNPATEGPSLLVLLAERFARQRPHHRGSAPRAPLAAGPSLHRDTVVTRMNSAFRSVIAWFRAGYPEEAPATGYCPLLALNGPVALTPQQTRDIVDAVGGAPADIIDIEVAITKATDRLPTRTQIRAVTTALHHR